jgi:hypothetical protein
MGKRRVCDPCGRIAYAPAPRSIATLETRRSGPRPPWGGICGAIDRERSRRDVIWMSTPTVFALGCTGTPRPTPITYGSKVGGMVESSWMPAYA